MKTKPITQEDITRALRFYQRMGGLIHTLPPEPEPVRDKAGDWAGAGYEDLKKEVHSE